MKGKVKVRIGTQIIEEIGVVEALDRDVVCLLL